MISIYTEETLTVQNTNNGTRRMAEIAGEYLMSHSGYLEMEADFGGRIFKQEWFLYDGKNSPAGKCAEGVQCSCQVDDVLKRLPEADSFHYYYRPLDETSIQFRNRDLYLPMMNNDTDLIKNVRYRCVEQVGEKDILFMYSFDEKGWNDNAGTPVSLEKIEEVEDELYGYWPILKFRAGGISANINLFEEIMEKVIYETENLPMEFTCALPMEIGYNENEDYFEICLDGGCFFESKDIKDIIEGLNGIIREFMRIEPLVDEVFYDINISASRYNNDFDVIRLCAGSDTENKQMHVQCRRL